MENYVYQFWLLIEIDIVTYKVVYTAVYVYIFIIRGLGDFFVCA